MISRGSEWAKWDLHMHSNYSCESRANMSVKEIFDNAIKSEIKMIAITDHNNFDSLDDIWTIYDEEYSNGKKYKDLVNFLPAIELKTDKGQKGVHIICIFPKIIEINNNLVKATKDFLYDNFCSQLNLTKAKVEVNGNGSYAEGLFRTNVSFDKAIELTHELGGLVIIHGGDKHGSIEEEISHATDNKNLDKVYKALDITKKEIMSKSIDIIELPNFSNKQAKNARFYKKNFNKPCILGSDAHTRDEYNSSERKYMWIKAKATFNGLKQAIIDYENRIYLGELPEQLKRVKENPTKYIDFLNIDWIDTYNGEKGDWFKNINIPLNSGLVSIIGNKGNGKSAIAEIISWLSDSYKYENFAFLNNKKFLKNKLANNFIGEIKWKANNINNKKVLSEKPNTNNIEKVQSIPQQYFEEICTDIEIEKFTNEINGVIYSRLSDEDRENEATLDSLINKYSKVAKENIDYLKVHLSNKNEEIIELESKLLSSYRENLISRISDIETKIEEHIKLCPKKVEKPNTESEEQKKYNYLNEDIKRHKEEIEKLNSEILNFNNSIKELNMFLEEIKCLFERTNSDKSRLNVTSLKYGLDIDEIIKVNINTEIIESKIKQITNEISNKKSILKLKKESVTNKEKEKKDILNMESQELSKYNDYIKYYESWSKNKDILNKNKTNINDELTYLDKQIHIDLEKLYYERRKISRDIFNEKNKILNIYDKFKKPIDIFLKENEELLDGYNMQIRSGLVIKDNFEGNVFSFINKQRKNVFRDDEYDLDKTVDGLLSIEDSSEYSQIPEMIISKMSSYEVCISLQIKDKKLLDFYNYIYGLDYIDNKYELISDNKTLDKLSPGERGALLLIFYLLLDMNDTPLIIDQPEDNLDNQSVTKILVPFIQVAKKRRQIIMVTHNPNLAIVADSDQIINVSINKDDNMRVNIQSGGIEDLEINESCVTILEGTMNSFRRREEKYIYY